MTIYNVASAQMMHSLGVWFASVLKPNCVVSFFGDLAAGKTTFIKGMAESLGVDPNTVNSPTFQYLNIYQGPYQDSPSIFHFDLYRLENSEDFLAMGFEELFCRGGITCIEWAERIGAILPKNCIHVSIAHTENGQRQVKIEPLEIVS